MPKTSRYKNSKALSAWLCIDADTLRSVVSIVRKAFTCGAAISRGYAIGPARPCQRTKKSTQ